MSLSLLTDTAINKALYMLEEKYEKLNDGGSKATFLSKIEALIIEEIVTPKALLCIKNKGRSAFLKRDLFLSECQDKDAKKKKKAIQTQNQSR
ncbi:3293_t:CDS:1 [Racocetra fulgida]|uniref:3293_t:CDS:1 n=1 Tax=Racocetra fulgida TaxID=60492 RepID=A0A9N9P1E2_9GLOM|nr:3293_t:CDS:1 [Racocetra fulgida]